jgi:hypothetical protein
MHKPTQQPETCRLESASTPAMCFLREKHTFDHGCLRFGRSDRKVPATYFPLFENEPTKTPRKTASRVRQLESTCIPKKTNEWKVQTAQKTRPNSPLGHARLESVPSNHRDPVNRSCGSDVVIAPNSLLPVPSPLCHFLLLVVIFSKKIDTRFLPEWKPR